MIKRIQIENYKSIRKLDLELGRLNVFIGENGCGKTNILEAIALGSAAGQDRVANEFLAPRGIRVTSPQFMRSAFEEQDPAQGIDISFEDEDGWNPVFRIVPTEAEGAISWTTMVGDVALYNGEPWAPPGAEPPPHVYAVTTVPAKGAERALTTFSSFQESLRERTRVRTGPTIRKAKNEVPDFLVYAPENSILRNLPYEGQILPLGVKGEGLLAHLQALASHPDAPVIAEINEHLQLLDWFETLQVPDKDQAGRALRIRDRFLPEGVVFDQRSANEGFLFLLFYFTLFASAHTPRFFAIDNVDASLNPKMCAALMASMVRLAKAHDKQAIVTTHNPSLLDGLDLSDDEQRLFVVSRRPDGSTGIRRVEAPRPLEGTTPVLLSEAFVRGYIGGLPKNF